MDFVPCDYALKTLLPELRAEVARLLSAKGWTQERIASALGLSQAAVSKYLSSKKPVSAKINGLARAVVRKIIAKKGRVELKLCGACGGRGLLICELSKK